MNKETYKRILTSLIILPIAFFFIIKGSIFFLFFISAFFIVNAYEWINMSKNKPYLIPGIIFLLFSSYTTYLLRGNSENDLIIFSFVIFVCITTDIGGYIFGNLFKGPKLTKISPKKTYSGMLGSFFLSIIFSYIIYERYFITIFPNEFIFLIIVFLISLVSQIGDLILSFFKRISKIKNTGNLLPGHGGFLDRVDGMIFAIPFAYLLFDFF